MRLFLRLVLVFRSPPFLRALLRFVFLSSCAFLGWHLSTSGFLPMLSAEAILPLALSKGARLSKLLITMLLRTTRLSQESIYFNVAGYSPLSCHGRGRNDGQKMVEGS